MKRSAPLERHTPLVSSTPLRRTSALNRGPLARSVLHAQSAMRRQQPKRTTASGPRVPAKVRAALEERSGGLCEIGQQGCTGVAVEFSHRKKVGAGGRKGAARAAHDVLSNALHACWHCHHSGLHANPDVAYDMGWMLREHQTPAAERVLYRGAWRWLSDAGAVLTINPFPDAEETRSA